MNCPVQHEALSMKRILLIFTLLATACHAAPQGMTDFLKTKYGFFVHYVWGGKQGTQFTRDRDGRQTATFDGLANAFDAKGFANDLDRWGVEYVILTAWHYNINPLFPSATMKKWGLERHACSRDVLRDVIDACQAKGIKVMFYTHPRDGHDLALEDQLKTGWGGPNGTDPKWDTFDRKKWNDFTNELYAELIDRYGKDIIGIYSDEGSGAGDSYRVVDYPRLRQTVKSRQPALVMVQNFYGTMYSLDLGCKEYHHWGEFEQRDANAWPTCRMPVATCFATTWWSAEPAGKNTVVFTPEDMFRYSVLQAGANHEGGGVQWAAGNYAGGGWETGVDETMTKLASYVKPVAAAIKNTYASTSWSTAAGVKLPALAWGVATRSTDDKTEYLHILKPPAGGVNNLTLPPPADGKRFAKAIRLPGRMKVGLTQNAAGVTLVLPAGERWDGLDTVIALQVAADSPPTNVAQWKAFSASSFPDPSPGRGSAYAFHAVDGDPATVWTSRPNGATEGNVPQPPDLRPWCQVDLGMPCNLTRVEVVGPLVAGVALQVSSTADFSAVKTVAISGEAKPVTLVITKATYGAGAQQADVTGKLRAAIIDGCLTVKSENALAGGDPAPSIPKDLRVEYTLDGAAKSAVVAENGTLELGCGTPWTIDLPAGTTVRFVRLARTADGPPLVVNEFRVFGKFE